MALTDTLCSNCGASPCYHICPNSPHFYSPEKERQDDAFYGSDDVYERYAHELDGLEDHEDAEEDAVHFDFLESLSPAAPRPVDPADIPF